MWRRPDPPPTTLTPDQLAAVAEDMAVLSESDDPLDIWPLVDEPAWWEAITDLPDH